MYRAALGSRSCSSKGEGSSESKSWLSSRTLISITAGPDDPPDGAWPLARDVSVTWSSSLILGCDPATLPPTCGCGRVPVKRPDAPPAHCGRRGHGGTHWRAPTPTRSTDDPAPQDPVRVRHAPPAPRRAPGLVPLLARTATGERRP